MKYLHNDSDEPMKDQYDDDDDEKDDADDDDDDDDDDGGDESRKIRSEIIFQC